MEKYRRGKCKCTVLHLGRNNCMHQYRLEVELLGRGMALWRMV